MLRPALHYVLPDKSPKMPHKKSVQRDLRVIRCGEAQEEPGRRSGSIDARSMTPGRVRG